MTIETYASATADGTVPGAVVREYEMQHLCAWTIISILSYSRRN